MARKVRAAGKKLKDAGEEALIRALVSLHDPGGRTRIGDDCAVIKVGGETLLATTDLTLDGVHYPLEAKPELKGWYAAAVNLSDIASMGGEPLGLLIAYGIPANTDRRTFDGIAKGVEACAKHHGTRVIGGDTKQSSMLSITGTALGIALNGAVLWRGGAQRGDALVMTGKCGRIQQWLASEGKRGVERLLKVEARLAEGRALAIAGATSCIDTSDGFALSAHYLAEASGLGHTIDMNCIEFYDGIGREDRTEAMYHGGDYELLATVPLARLEAACEAVKRVGGRLSIVGKVGGNRMVYMDDCCVRPLERRGYQHFSEG